MFSFDYDNNNVIAGTRHEKMVMQSLATGVTATYYINARSAYQTTKTTQP